MKVFSKLCAFLFLAISTSWVISQDTGEKKGSKKKAVSRIVLETGGHHSEVIAMSFREEGKELVTVTRDKDIRIWDTKSGELKEVLRPKMLGVEAAAFSKDQQYLAVAGVGMKEKFEHLVLVIDLKSRDIKQMLPAPDLADRNLWSLAFAGNGRFMAAGRNGYKSLHFWNLKKGTDPREPSDQPGTSHYFGVAFSPDSKYLALAADLVQELRIFDVPSLKLVSKTKIDDVRCVNWPSADRLYIGGKNGIQVWNNADKKITTTWLKGPTNAIDQSPDGKMLLVVGQDKKGQARAAMLNPVSGEQLRYIPLANPAPMACAFAPDSRHWATAYGPDGGVRVFDSVNKVVTWKLVGRGSMTENAAFAGDHVVVWKQAGKTRAFDFSTLDFVNVPKKTGSSQRRYVFKDGFLQEASENVVWHKNGVNRYLHGHTGKITALGLSPKNKYLVTSSEDQTIRIWIPDGEHSTPLLNLFVAGNDWVAWTQSGYFTGTPSGVRMIGMHIGGSGPEKLAQFLPIDRFQGNFERPELIKLVLEKGSVKDALAAVNSSTTKTQIKTRDVEIESTLPPLTTISVDESKKPTITVTAKAVAASQGQPVKSLKLFVDGRPASIEGVEVAFNAGKTEADASWTLTLPDGDHKIAVRGAGPDSSNFSKPYSLSSTPISKLPTMHVLCVGVSQYQNAGLNLNAAATDASNARRAFAKNCPGEVFGTVSAAELLDKDAQAKPILENIAEIRKKAEPSDLFVLFFAGHGVKEADQFYLLTHDAKLNDLKGSSISGEALVKALGDFKCQVVLMMDACYSGAIGGRPSAVSDAARVLTTDDVGVVVFSAAMGNQKAIEVKGKGGLFTQALVDALEAGPSVPRNPYNSRIYVHHLKSHITDYVVHHSDDRQTPFVNLPWTVESFPIRGKK